MTTKFKVGDVVRLKSFSPHLTVTRVNVNAEGSVQTTFFEAVSGEFRNVILPCDAIAISNNGEPK